MAQTRPDQTQPISIIPRPNLREQFFGAWVGIKRGELAKDPAFHAYKADPVNVPPPGGENLKDFSARVRQDFNELAGAHSGKNIVLFTHAGVIRAEAAEAKGIDMLAALKLPVTPLSLTILSHDSGEKGPWTKSMDPRSDKSETLITAVAGRWRCKARSACRCVRRSG